MRLAVRRSLFSIFLLLGISAATASAQTTPAATVEPAAKPAIAAAPTSAEVMRDRINKAKAYLAVRNYNAAIFELENIRRESAEPSVQSVTSVLLMTCYLEKGDFKKAQDLLTIYFNSQKTTKPEALTSYAAVAGQIIKAARNQAERYRSLGIPVSDRSLPIESLTELEKLRELLETVVTQTKEISADQVKANAAFGLLEEAAAARALIARDDYDARRWRDELSEWREQMASSRSVVVNAMDGSTEMPMSGNPAETTTLRPQALPAGSQPQAVVSGPAQPSANLLNPVPANPARATTEPTPETGRPRTVSQPDEGRKDAGKAVTNAGNSPDAASSAEANDRSSQKGATPAGPVAVGSLLPYATRQVPPVYPPAARSARTTGVVRVELILDEQGEIAEIKSVNGPTLLQESAKDAVRKWKFRPLMLNGQAVRAAGFVSFNFSL